MKTIFTILAIGVFTVIQAQDNNFRLTFDTQFQTGLGYKNPSVGTGIGGSKQLTDKWTLDGSARFMRARKIDGGGFNVGGSLEIRRRLTPSMFVLGGVSISHQTTSFYNKVSTNPVLGIGFKHRDFYPSFRVLLPDVTSPNKIYGVEVRSEYYVPTKSRIGLYLEARVAVMRFKCFQGPVGLTDNCNGASVTTRVGVYRKGGTAN